MELIEISPKSVAKVGEISVFMKNPKNNPGNYCKSLFLETDDMAGPLNPE